MLIRYTLVLLLAIFRLYSPTAAKGNKDLMKADYFYNHYAYTDAIPYFEKVADSLKSAAVYTRLADCYLITNDLPAAAMAYDKAVHTEGYNKDILLRYAQLLMELSRYEEAGKWLKEYQLTNSADKRVANLIAGCDMGAAVNDSMLPGSAILQPFNTDGSDFAPTMWNGKLVFASDTAIDIKKKTDRWTGRAYYNLYSVPCDGSGQCGGSLARVAEGKEVNIKYHNGPCTFSADGRQMYYTRSRYGGGLLSTKAVTNKDSMVLLEIMIATDYDSVEKRFRTIKPFAYNSEKYAVAHPSVSPDGRRLAFSSNMPGGHGRSDIYTCMSVNGSWQAPQSAGDAINTEGEELFPYWADDSTLFFSSDGQAGLGGLDIYKCSFDRVANTFSAPEHLGKPVNSSYDDISLAMCSDGRSTWFSSNRPAARGSDNIYYYKKERIYLQLTVLDTTTGRPLPQATVQLDGQTDKKVLKTDADGKLFLRLYPEDNYSLAVNKQDYFTRQLQLTATSAKEVDTIIRTIYMLKPGKEVVVKAAPVPLVIRNRNIMDTPGIKEFKLNEVYEIGHFYYDYNKYELTSVHKIFLDSLLTQMNRHTTMNIEVRAHTDCRGSVALNLSLSNSRALTVVNYLVQHGIARGRLTYRGMGYSDPAVKCPTCEECTEEQHNLNRILEFKVLQL